MKTDLLFSSFPFISGEKISLSQMQATDAKELSELYGEEFSPAEFLRTAESAFNGRMYIQLGIYRQENMNELLGTLKIEDFNYEVNSVGINFAIRENYWGKGVAEGALLATLNYLFAIMDLNRVHAESVNANPKWERVLRHCGFTREALLRESVCIPEKGICDYSCYALLKRDYPLVANAQLISREEGLSIVRMTGEDYRQMSQWLTDEKVLKYYDGRDNPSDLHQVIETYRPLVMGEDESTPCILREEGRAVGYIQFYPITKERAELKVDTFKAPYGIDLFIGEADCRGRGLGPRFLRMLSAYLLSEMDADVLVGDPQAWNQRSINAFARAGFTQEAILPDHELHEGKMEANVIMLRTGE
ncbi:MAG: GNAT family N-acetyltransferase [Oscillospiraceae bacterium]